MARETSLGPRPCSARPSRNSATGHANTALAESNLAHVLSRLNRPAEADSLYAHAVAILEHERPGAAGTAVTMVDFGIARMQAGNVAGAEAVLRRALDILRATVSAEDNRLHRTRNALGSGLDRVWRTPRGFFGHRLMEPA